MVNKVGYRTFDGKRLSLWAIGLSATFLVLIGLDLTSDYRDGVPWRHLLIEVMLLLLSLGILTYFGRYYFMLTQTKIGMLEHDLASARQQALQWREANRELVAGLARQIQLQFEFWKLTPAENQVAMLLLKVLSLAEIAELRNASERTIRDQARAVYGKAGVAGRAELSAFFLEDLLPGV